MNQEEIENKLKDVIAEKNKILKRLDTLEESLKDGKLNVREIKVGLTNSDYTITIVANERLSGLWVSGPENNGSVALYNDSIGGAVMGVWGSQKDTAMDIAFSAKQGPVMQIYDRKQGSLYMIDTSQISNFAQKINLK